MVIFFEELIMLIFLWFLKLIDGIMEIFDGISGITTIQYRNQEVNIIDLVIGDSTITTIFWCIFILAIGLTCIFTIVALIKNMIANNRNLTGILGKFFLALLGTLAMIAVVFLGILISNTILRLVAEIFQIGNTTKLSNSLFNACVKEWINGYKINEVDITNLSVREIMGDYKTAMFGIWPTSWKMNGMINPDNFMYLPSMIAAIGLMIALIVAILNLAKRVYEIGLLYLTLPVLMSTLPLDDGAKFKMWRETFITKIILAYGTIFSVNVFLLLLPIISQVKIIGVGSFGNTIFLIFMIIGGAMVIPAGQTLFTRLFGQADDVQAGGGFLRNAFYGSRIAGIATIGVASKIIRGASSIGKKVIKPKKRKEEDNDNQYIEENQDTNQDEGGTQTE